VKTTNQKITEKRIDSVEALQNLDINLVQLNDEFDTSSRELKGFLYENLYRHPRVVRMQVKAERILSDLYNTYLSEPAMLPLHVQKRIEKTGLERTICDYIAGMTDRFAIEEYNKLFDPSIKP
jgi:dGTPase